MVVATAAAAAAISALTFEIEADNEADARSQLAAKMADPSFDFSALKSQTGVNKFEDGDEAYIVDAFAIPEPAPSTMTAADPAGKAPPNGNNSSAAAGTAKVMQNSPGNTGRLERNMAPLQKGTVDASTGMGPAKSRPGDLPRSGLSASLPAENIGPGGVAQPPSQRSQAVPEPGRALGDGSPPATSRDPGSVSTLTKGEAVDPKAQEGSIQYAPPGYQKGPLKTAAQLQAEREASENEESAAARAKAEGQHPAPAGQEPVDHHV